MRPFPVDPAARLQALRRKPSCRSHGTGSFAENLAAADPADVGEGPPAVPSATLLALLDVQEVESNGSAGRRRAAVCRGDVLLSQLEGLRAELLEGRIGAPRLQALAAALREERMVSDDAGVEVVLAEIELRVEVEMAKLAVAPAVGSPKLADVQGFR
ncbi:MAG: hypothetical protein JNM48_10390 [Rhodospirillales bacterium]|nr:hypothetical protein [Rhodospirillales bacterium]